MEQEKQQNNRKVLLAIGAAFLLVIGVGIGYAIGVSNVKTQVVFKYIKPKPPSNNASGVWAFASVMTGGQGESSVPFTLSQGYNGEVSGTLEEYNNPSYTMPLRGEITPSTGFFTLSGSEGLTATTIIGTIHGATMSGTITQNNSSDSFVGKKTK